MVSDSVSPPEWLAQQPSAFDIVTAKFPEREPKGALQLRPCLVLDVLRGKVSGKVACRVAFGTKNLKFIQRRGLDLIIQNAADLDAIGLPLATRFDLDNRNVVDLPWTDESFGCWAGHRHPKLGSLTEEYVKEYLYIMALRQANKQP